MSLRMTQANHITKKEFGGIGCMFLIVIKNNFVFYRPQGRGFNTWHLYNFKYGLGCDDNWVTI